MNSTIKSIGIGLLYMNVRPEYVTRFQNSYMEKWGILTRWVISHLCTLPMGEKKIRAPKSNSTKRDFVGAI